MKIDIPISFLQSGNDLKITSNLTCRHPTLNDIWQIDQETNGFRSEALYYQMVSVFLTDPYDYMVFLDDNRLDYEAVSPFDVFCMLFAEYTKHWIDTNPVKAAGDMLNSNLYFQAFHFFLGVDFFTLAQTADGENVLLDSSNNILMDSTVYGLCSEFIRMMNGIGEADKIRPEDGFAKKVLVEDSREEIKRKSKKKQETPPNRLGNLISSVTWGSTGAATPFNRRALHIYDLVDGLYRTDKKLNFKNNMIGLYSGCIDKKNINFEKTYWSN